MVVIAHCNPPRAFLVYHTFDLSWLLFSAGGVAVRIFFCLSGYLMGKAFYTKRYTVNRSGILNFWRNRALRVLPLYYFSVLVTGFVVYPDLFKIENGYYLLRIITFTYDQTLPVAFNGALWTLSTEVQFYILVPFIFRYLNDRLRSKKQIFFLASGLMLGSFSLRLVLWIAIQTYLDSPEDAIAFVRYIYVPLWMNIDVFLAGFLLNFLINSRFKSTPVNPDNITPYRVLKADLVRSKFKFISLINWKLISIASLVCLYVVTAYLKYYHSQILGILSPTLTLLATCGFIYAFERENRSETRGSRRLGSGLQACRNSSWRLLEWLGILSYGIYIWHLPILAKLQPILTSAIPIHAYLYRFSATLILSIILSSLTYFAIESPMANLKRFKRSPATPSNKR